MKHITIRNVPPELARALDRDEHRRGRSLNQTVIALLQQALGLGQRGRRTNGLARLGGTWSAAELRRFEEATAAMEQVDEELWR